MPRRFSCLAISVSSCLGWPSSSWSSRSSSSAPAAPRTPPRTPARRRSSCKDAKPVGGVKDVTFKKGGTVDLTVKSDTADEVHFHGYDVHKDVAKGGSVHFSFPASIEGKFIVELENHKQTLANVTVAP